MEKLIFKLIDMDLIDNNGNVVFTDEAKELIHTIANQCRNTKLYQHATEKAHVFSEGKTAEELYSKMLTRIAFAPTQLHMISSAILIIPLISDKLN